MVASGAGRVEVVGLQYAAHPSRRVVQVQVAATEHQRLSRGGLGQAEQHPQRGTGPVRTEEPGHCSPVQAERQIIDRNEGAVALAQ